MDGSLIGGAKTDVLHGERTVGRSQGITLNFETRRQGSLQHLSFCTEIVLCYPLPERKLRGQNDGFRVRNFFYFFELTLLLTCCTLIYGCDDTRVMALRSEGNHNTATDMDILYKGWGQYIGKLPLHGEGKQYVNEENRSILNNRSILIVPD